MEWWDDLWLNEGFASFVEYIGASVVDDSWKMVRRCSVINVNHTAKKNVDSSKKLSICRLKFKWGLTDESCLKKQLLPSSPFCIMSLIVV